MGDEEFAKWITAYFYHHKCDEITWKLRLNKSNVSWMELKK